KPSLIFRLGNHVRLTTQLDYANNVDNLQYVGSIKPEENTEDKMIYMLGKMKQKTYGMTINMQINLTPDMSIQFYGSPFTSIANFNEFKQATNTQSSNYTERFKRFSSEQLSLKDNLYTITDEGKNITFKNRNVSFKEFRSNLVARWEYLPGSTSYFVWENSRSNQEMLYQPGWGNNLDNMFGIPSTNTFMLKLNYWFSL